VEILVHSDGRIDVVIGTLSSGQGHETSFSRLVTKWLGVAIGAVTVKRNLLTYFHSKKLRACEGEFKKWSEHSIAAGAFSRAWRASSRAVHSSCGYQRCQSLPPHPHMVLQARRGRLI
jgi:Molybdopterin-binding domain of aldehyde dehydrogenase